MRSWRVRLSCAVLAIALLSASTAFAAPTTGSADETIGFTETRTPGALRERIYGEPLTVDTPEIYLPTLDVGIATAGVVAERISGVDRYATAAAAALEASSTADTAVIVSGTQQLDAGFAAGLAGVYGCPVLAT